MASLVDPGYAFNTRLTTTLEVPYPAGAVVSRAPKTWTFGQLWRSSNAASGEAPQCAKRRAVAAARTLCIVNVSRDVTAVRIRVLDFCLRSPYLGRRGRRPLWMWCETMKSFVPFPRTCQSYYRRDMIAGTPHVQPAATMAFPQKRCATELQYAHVVSAPRKLLWQYKVGCFARCVTFRIHPECSGPL